MTTHEIDRLITEYQDAAEEYWIDQDFGESSDANYDKIVAALKQLAVAINKQLP